MSPKLTRFLWSLRLNGVIGSIRVGTAMAKRRLLRRPIDEQYCIARDSHFDGRFGVETASVVEVEALDVPEALRDQSAEYRPTSSVAAATTLDLLPIDKSKYHLVDIGCGKGRVLVIASLMPFAGVTGIELSPTLAQRARENLEATGLKKRCNAVEVIEGDATEVSFPPQPLVVYLFNPFDRPLVEKLAHRLAHELSTNPRDCRLVYANAVHRNVFEDSDDWLAHQQRDLWWGIYQWRPNTNSAAASTTNT